MRVHATLLLRFIELLEIFVPSERGSVLLIEGGPHSNLGFEVWGGSHSWRGLDLRPLQTLGWYAGTYYLEPPEDEDEDGDDVFALAISALEDQLGGP